MLVDMEINPLKIYLRLFAVRTDTRTEADVQTNIAAFLTLADIGLTEGQVSKTEDQLADGTRRRIDIAYGHLVIEVKRDLSLGKVLEKTVPQLSGYLHVRQEQEGIKYAGIITDGADWHLYSLNNGEDLQIVDHHYVDIEDSDSDERLALWLQTVLLTGEQIKVTPSAIKERLGTESPRFKLDRARLESVYLRHPKPDEVGTKKHLWARLLRTALGTGFEDSASLFIDHTLLVVEAEIIAHLVIGINPSDYSVKALVSGDVFRRAGIYNVVAEDFFDWVSDSPEGEEFVRSLTRELQQFDWTDLEHDVLKVLYEAVIDKSVRKALGEYYTPDWLAKKIVSEMNFDLLEKRAMDPSCGSGTFLFHLVKKFLKEADEKGLSGPDSLDLLQDRVWGLDIHPVSVVLARVTYLLSIGTARLKNRNTIVIPVYLGDSIQWTRGANLVGAKTLSVDITSDDLASAFDESQPTLFEAEDALSFPLSVLEDPALFDRLVGDMADLAQTYSSRVKPIPDLSTVLARHQVTYKNDVDILGKTFSILCGLNADGRNHIWGYFVRNQVRPVWFSQPANRVDVLVGNPPWVAYRFMTDKMQKGFKALSQKRNLWSGGKVSTNQDLVGLFIARTVEQFLKLDGEFGFVVPFAVLSRTQYEGFRSGRWATDAPDGIEGKLQSVRVRFLPSWDMSDVKPAIFPVPSGVVFGVKSIQAVALTEKNIKFEGLVGNLKSTSSSAGQLTSNVEQRSIYAPRAFQGAILTPRVLMTVTESQPSNSLGTPIGLLQVRSQRSTLEKEPWKSVTGLEGLVEAKYLFDVLTGSSIAPFRILSKWKTVLPVVNGKLLENSKDLDASMAIWWASVEKMWIKHRGKSQLSMLDNIDYQSKLSKQLSSNSRRVVYTTSGTRLCSTYIGLDKDIIDTKLYWISVESDDEGFYLATILNSDRVQEAVRGLQSKGLFGPRDFHTLPLSLPIPAFNPNNAEHIELAKIGRLASEEMMAIEIAEPEKFVAARRIIQQALDVSLQKRIEPLVEKFVSS